MYANLEAEIVRNRISKETIAKKIGKTYTTFTMKLNEKSSFLYGEALTIQESFFPDVDIKYLFQRDDVEKAG